MTRLLAASIAICTLAICLATASAQPVAEANSRARDERVPDNGDNAADSSSRPTGEPDDVVTKYVRLTTFQIPYGFDPKIDQGYETMLCVSADRGANWSEYWRQSPRGRVFPFRAARDGEFWFTVLTVQQGSKQTDLSMLKPQLRIFVDTKLPRIKLNAVVSPQGDLQAAWEVFDANLDRGSVALEYQSDQDRTWRPIEADEPTGSADNNILRGKTAWKPPTGVERINIRVIARDLAENVGVQTRSVALSPAASDPGPARPDRPNSGTAGPGTLGPGTLPSNIPSDPFAIHGTPPYSGFQPPRTGDERQAQRPVSPSVGEQADANAPLARTTTWPSDNGDPTRSTSAAASGQFSNTAPSGEPSTVDDDGRWQAPPSPEDDDPTDEGGSNELRDPTAEELANRPLLPNGERPQMTRSRKFNLAYSIDAVGPAGAEKVELWVTRNGGRDWNLWGVDEDLQSPLLVEVQDEGIYGFRIKVIGKNGLAGATPRPGDLADLWVGVDTTKPQAEITNAAYGSGVHAGELDLRWRAVDKHLASRPVTLQFSDTPDGNWTTIASGLPNTGQYYWRVDSRVPSHFYVKLEVRDEAGNVAVHQLKEPLASAGLIPKGTIRGLSPLQ